MSCVLIRPFFWCLVFDASGIKAELLEQFEFTLFVESRWPCLNESERALCSLNGRARGCSYSSKARSLSSSSVITEVARLMRFGGDCDNDNVRES
jgi:hypothetical protein